MAQLNESQLIERLHALREPLPDAGFSARLRERLEREAASPKVVPIRTPRSPRRRMLWLIAAAIPLAALAAAAANGWAPFRSAPPVPPVEPPTDEAPAPAITPSATAKPRAPRVVESAAPPPSAPSVDRARVQPERVPRRKPSASPPPERIAPRTVPDLAPEPSSAAAPARVERMKIETRGAPGATQHESVRRELGRHGGEQDRAGAGERRREHADAAKERRQRGDKSDRGERREKRRGKAGGGQGR